MEEFLKRADSKEFDRFNLSDIFEYVGPEDYHCLLQRLLQRGKQDARLAYWNMRVERSRPAFLQDRLRPMTELARQLYREDKVFFYSAFVVEEAL